MTPKQLFDLLWMASPVALVCGLIGLGIGVAAFDASGCNFLTTPGCEPGEGTVLGLHAGSRAEAGFLIGAICAGLGLLGGFFYADHKKNHSGS
jgi:hypothetical protein